MKKAPLVTVVTVTRNAEYLIEKTIKSVISQNYSNIEYIVIDGNSTDNTVNIIEKYAAYISKFVQEDDEGIYDAMNKGVSFASHNSQYITFLNAGDVFYDLNVINDIVSEPSIKSHIYGNILKNEKLARTPDRITQYILSTNMVCHQAIFFRTEIHKKFLYDIRFKLCADYKLLIDLVYAGEQFTKVNKIIVEYDTNGITNQNRSTLHLEKKNIRKQYPFIFLLNILKIQYKNLQKFLKSYS